ncbi:unnamed protein product [Gadus morhua 'NCC']
MQTEIHQNQGRRLQGSLFAYFAAADVIQTQTTACTEAKREHSWLQIHRFKQLDSFGHQLSFCCHSIRCLAASFYGRTRKPPMATDPFEREEELKPGTTTPKERREGLGCKQALAVFSEGPVRHICTGGPHQ